MGHGGSKKDNSEIVVSSYTQNMGHTWGEGKGVAIFSQNGSKLKLEQEIPIDVGTPSFLELTKTHIYVALEIEKGVILCIDRKTREVVSTSEIIGFAPCHLKLHHTHRILFVANYVSGELVALGLNRSGLFTGKWTTAKSEKEPTGENGIQERQEACHGHCVLPIDHTDYVLFSDLGTDEVICFRINCESLEMTKTSVATFPPGYGPRTLVKHKEFVYCSCELNSHVATLKYEGNGIVKYIGSVLALPDDFAEATCMSHLAVSPCGKYVIAGNRVHVSPIGFKPSKEKIANYDKKTHSVHFASELRSALGGCLSVLKIVFSGLVFDSMHHSFGLTPRAFSFGGDVLYLCNQDTNTLTRLRFKKGRFEFIDEYPVGSPNCALVG